MSYKDMNIWKRSCRLSVSICQELSNSTDFDFTNQITRSGLSIPSNIAEGFGATPNKNKNYFLNYAKSSCAELKMHIDTGMKIGYIQKESGKNWNQEIIEITSMLTKLMKYLKNY
jgi:four helix bundle protein